MEFYIFTNRFGISIKKERKLLYEQKRILCDSKYQW